MSRARTLANLLSTLDISGDVTLDSLTANTLISTGPVTAPVVTANTLAGTLSTAAQPNITSVGTLASLSSSGLISSATFSGNTINVDTSSANSYYEKTIIQNVVAATTVDLSTATTFVHTLDGNVTYTLSNPPASGTTQGITLKLVQDSNANGYTVTWPASVNWAGNTAPTLSNTASAVDIITLFTHDGGTNYYGFAAGLNMQ